MKGGKNLSWVSAGVVILAWGVTFANTRALLRDFSALEIQLLRFALAWLALRAGELLPRRGECAADAFSWRGELLFVGMGLAGVAVYQFLENCAIYYTNASNVAILVSFGPIVTAVLARIISGDRSLSARLVAGSLVAICGVALVSLNGVVNFQMRPIGDLMALGASFSVTLDSDINIERFSRPGERYCKQHSSSVTPKKPPAQCMSMTEKGKQCENKPAEGKRYCSRHL